MVVEGIIRIFQSLNRIFGEFKGLNRKLSELNGNIRILKVLLLRSLALIAFFFFTQLKFSSKKQAGETSVSWQGRLLFNDHFSAFLTQTEQLKKKYE